MVGFSVVDFIPLLQWILGSKENYTIHTYISRTSTYPQNCIIFSICEPGTLPR